MLEAFTTHELLSNIPVQIEYICTYEDRLLVGTKQVTKAHSFRYHGQRYYGYLHHDYHDVTYKQHQLN